MSEIRYTTSPDNNHILNESPEINNSDGDFSLSTKYPESAINQNDKIVNNAIKMIWVGIILLLVGLIISVFTKQNLIPMIPGAFVDIFSEMMIYLVNKSSYISLTILSS